MTHMACFIIIMSFDVSRNLSFRRSLPVAGIVCGCDVWQSWNTRRWIQIGQWRRPRWFVIIRHITARAVRSVRRFCRRLVCARVCVSWLRILSWFLSNLSDWRDRCEFGNWGPSGRLVDPVLVLFEVSLVTFFWASHTKALLLSTFFTVPSRLKGYRAVQVGSIPDHVHVNVNDCPGNIFVNLLIMSVLFKTVLYTIDSITIPDTRIIHLSSLWTCE